MKAPIVEEDFLKGLRILIVDDMPFMRSFIKNCVKISFPSCVCYDAADGNSAIEKLRTKSFSLVLCDWELPDIKGDEILRWVREESGAKDVPFIMVTANDEKESIMKVISLRVTDYVVKPLNCEILSQKIRVALRPK
jgi:DNA-binding response OmpR family regulator